MGGDRAAGRADQDAEAVAAVEPRQHAPPQFPLDLQRLSVHGDIETARARSGHRQGERQECAIGGPRDEGERRGEGHRRRDAYAVCGHAPDQSARHKDGRHRTEPGGMLGGPRSLGRTPKLSDAAIDQLAADVYGNIVKPRLAAFWKRAASWRDKNISLVFDHWFDDAGVLPEALKLAATRLHSLGVTHRVMTYTVRDGRLNNEPALSQSAT
jgi:hypothetical protein